VYFISGIVGVLCHFFVLRHGTDIHPLLGASGCIAGCAAYYSVRYVGLKVPVAPKLSLSVLAVTGIWVCLQVIGAFVRFDETGGVSFLAHLGGFAAGVVLSLLFRAPDLGQIQLGHEVLERMNNRGPAASASAAKKHLEKHPGDAKALGQLARACAQMDDEEGEADAIEKLLEIEPESEHASLIARMMEIGQGNRLKPHRRNIMAEKFKEGHPNVARMLLISVLQDPSDGTLRPEALLTLYELERDREPERAKALIDELVQGYPLHPCVDLARKRGWI
jgi:hypothetical protein